MGKFNKSQRLLVKTYEQGEYSHAKTIEEANKIDDKLFQFLLREVSEDEGCESIAEAIRRIESVQVMLGVIAEDMKMSLVAA